MKKNEELDDEEPTNSEIVEHLVFNGDQPPTQAPLDLDGTSSLEFDFELDLFQIESIKAINSGNSVFVIASTSAGKSVVAYHAISESLKKNAVAIYTAPVKSLANQKFVEISGKFPDVGLITGDVNNNPTASCLIMTAEVLRNQILARSPLLQQVCHIILDEAHYLGDSQRGVVWEQILLAAPPTARFVLLSATLPNYDEISRWLSSIHSTPIHCVMQKKRPVPLRIYALSDKNSPLLVKDGEEPVNNQGLSAICSSYSYLGGARQNAVLPKESPTYLTTNHANYLVNGGHLPLLLFCLSRKRCMKIAEELEGVPESGAITFFNQASAEWDDEILESKQFEQVKSCIQKGVGVHHSGIIPLLRETVELLFSSGHLVVLVATETFALGVNAPARAVFFPSLVKWSGTSFRGLNTSEFMQMAGRAGRRGFDEFGEVFIYVPEMTDPAFIASIVNAQAKTLLSQMRITSSLILSCVLIGTNPESFVGKSLLAFQNKENLPKLRKQLDELPKESSLDILNEYSAALNRIVQICVSPKNIGKVLVPGRLIYIVHAGIKWEWCSMISVEGPRHNITVLCSAIRNEEMQFMPSRDVTSAELIVITFPLSSIVSISNIVITNPKTVHGMNRASSFLGIIDRVLKKYNSIPQFQPFSVKIEGADSVKKLISKLQTYEKSFDVDVKKDILGYKALVDEKTRLEAQIKEAELKPFHSQIETVVNQLKSLQYLTSNNMLELKGRVALALRVDDPVPAVELLFNGFFTNLSIENVIISVSSFVESPPKIKYPKLIPVVELWNTEKQIIKSLGKLESPKKRLMFFTSKFLEHKSVERAISQMEGLSAGLAVRVLKRLKEFLVQFQEAAQVMNVPALVDKFKLAQVLLVDGCSFDSSLYKIE